MNLFEQTLQEFAGSLGMEQVRVTGESQAQSVFKIENVGTLELEQVGERQERVAVSLSAHIERAEEKELRRILQETHFRQRVDHPIHAFVSRNHALTFTAVLNAYDFTLPILHQYLELMDQLLDQLSPYMRITR